MSAGPILIWGAGAIGGTVGAYLARAGWDVLVLEWEFEDMAEQQAWWAGWTPSPGFWDQFKDPTDGRFDASSYLADNAYGFLPSNIVKPYWGYIKNKPAGFADHGPAAAATLRRTQARLLGTFERYGYEEIVEEIRPNRTARKPIANMV